jgi:hypothetical protein
MLPYRTRSMPFDIARVVALGASNLTRGFMSVVSSARAAWGPEIEIFAALGHGRSYGAPSRVGFRTLPGILESGLWRCLDSQARLPTRALVADIGNDILYGYSTEQILAWIEETLNRLQRLTQDISITDLPLASIRRLSNIKYLIFRTILFPSSRLSLQQVLDTAERITDRLTELARNRGARLIHLEPAWYGFDPIHFRPSLWQPVWQQILGIHPGSSRGGNSLIEGLKLYLMPPERRWLFGVEQRTPQSGVSLPAGGRVWLF